MFKRVLNTPLQMFETLGVLIKKCSKTMQQIDKRTPMSNCDFNKVALKCY